jgi:AcrR family transcriptional regulator
MTRTRIPKRPPDYHHGDLEKALLTAARMLLEKQGLDALSLRAVARAAGVSPAAPYHHFADKDALLAAISAQGFRELAHAMEQRMEKERLPSLRFRATGLGYIAFAVANPALFRLMFGGTRHRFSTDPVLAMAGLEARRVFETAVSDAVRASGHDTGEIPMTLLTAWSLTHGLAELVLTAEVMPQTYGATTAEELAEIMLTRLGSESAIAF